MKKVLIKGLALAFMGSLVMAGNAMALTIDQGTEILLVDGNLDADDDVILVSYDQSSIYNLYYSVDDSDWTQMNFFTSVTFDGGTVLDLAISTNGTVFYTLSGDSDNDSYDVTMEFDQIYDPFLAANPEILTPYYATLLLDWTVYGPAGTTVYSNTFSISDGDGMAPVPEPATMLLFGSGLAGLAGYSRRKIRKNN